MIYPSSSSEQTKNLGALLAADLPVSGRLATVIALQGDLGAGKTTFVQGFLRGLGISSRITSPTFVLMKRYKVKNKRLGIKDVFHMDWYRMRSESELQALGYNELLRDPQNVILIEWPERIPAALPPNTIRISFEHGHTEKERKIIKPNLRRRSVPRTQI